MNNNPILDALSQEGVLIHLSVRSGRAKRKLRAEDLGLDKSNITVREIQCIDPGQWLSQQGG